MMKIIVLDDNVERHQFHYSIRRRIGLAEYDLEITTSYIGDSFKFANCDYMFIHWNNIERDDIYNFSTTRFIKIFFSGGFDFKKQIDGDNIYIGEREIENYLLNEIQKCK